MKTLEQNSLEQVYIALFLASHPNLFPSVSKFSEIIIKFLDAERTSLTSIIPKDSIDFKLLKSELYVTINVTDPQKKIFKGPLGALLPSKAIEEITWDDVIQDIKKMLTDPNANLIDILPIFSVFSFRMLRVINPEAYNEAGKSFESYRIGIESEKNRSRTITPDEKIEPTTQLGIPMPKEYIDFINQSTYRSLLLERLSEDRQMHRTSWQRFTFTPVDAPIIENHIKHNLPIIGGPSTHIITLLTAAKCLQKTMEFNLTDDELYGLATAYQAYLTIPGYHASSEVLYSAAVCLKREYNFDDFLENIPSSIRQNPEFQSALKELTLFMQAGKTSESTFDKSHTLFFGKPDIDDKSTAPLNQKTIGSMAKN